MRLQGIIGITGRTPPSTRTGRNNNRTPQRNTESSAIGPGRGPIGSDGKGSWGEREGADSRRRNSRPERTERERGKPPRTGKEKSRQERTLGVRSGPPGTQETREGNLNRAQEPGTRLNNPSRMSGRARESSRNQAARPNHGPSPMGGAQSPTHRGKEGKRKTNERKEETRPNPGRVPGKEREKGEEKGKEE